MQIIHKYKSSILWMTLLASKYVQIILFTKASKIDFQKYSSCVSEVIFVCLCCIYRVLLKQLHT